MLKTVLWWTEKKQHLFETEIFYNFINVFTVTFKQFNASLLNKKKIEIEFIHYLKAE